MLSHVISLYDYTGLAVAPWARAGYSCFCYDIQHEHGRPRAEVHGRGSITYIHADLHDPSVLVDIVARHAGRTRLGFGFPVCTDLAASDSLHWRRKRVANPDFQERAAAHCRHAGEALDDTGAAWMVENPVGALTRLWRKWNYIFDPCEYGGYLPEDDVHPVYPEYIPPRDAYEKKTCLWTGGGFIMPTPIPVEPVREHTYDAEGNITASGSPQWRRLGGKSQKTKNIRAATPRGFVQGVFLANS